MTNPVSRHRNSRVCPLRFWRLNAEGLADLAPTLGEASLLDAFLRGCALLPIHLTAAAALGISSSPHQQSSSSQGKEQQALHLGLERSRTSTLWMLSAAGAHCRDKGLNGLLDPSAYPRMVQAYLPACDALCSPCPLWRPC